MADIIEIVDGNVSRETIISSGVPGPQGPPGAAGAAATYTHGQATLDTVWTIPHSRGIYPAGIHTENETGETIYGYTRTDPSVNETVLTWPVAVRGLARVN